MVSKGSKLLLGGLAFLLTSCIPEIIPPSVPEIPYTPPVEEEESDDEENEEEEPIPRGDLLVSIDTDTYPVGGKFEYSGRVQSSRMEDILINDVEGLFEWRLLKEGKNFYSDKIKDDFEIVFWSQGFLEVCYEDNKIKIRTSNTKITYDGKTYYIPHPIITNITKDADTYTFTEAGLYTLQLWATYNYEGEWHDTLFKSKEFLVK